jgi:uncharacterized protein
MRTDLRATALPASILLGLLSGPAAALEPAHLVAGFPRGQAVLETGGPRCLLLDVFIASTPAQRSQGLMFVESLGEFEGMYFAYGTATELVMWMKNTAVSLDMLFIRSDGAVGSIARDTEPYSTKRISSGVPVAGVLEVNAGFASRWRVEPGTRLLML